MPTPLWAPWRMPYILRTPDGPRDSKSDQKHDKNEKKGSGCFFCDDLSSQAPAYREKLVVIVQQHALVCLNRYPFAAGHLLVAPRRHVGELTDLTEEEYVALMGLLRETSKRLKSAVSCPAMNIGFNLGLHAGAGVADHLHGHLVPRWPGDTNFMPVLADIRVMPEYLDQTWVRLYAAFADLPGDRAPSPDASSPTESTG